MLFADWYNNTKHFLCPIRSQYSFDRLEMVRWESIPRGFSACAWKLSSLLFSRPDWPPWVSEDERLYTIYGRLTRNTWLANVRKNVWSKNLCMLPSQEEDIELLWKCPSHYLLTLKTVVYGKMKTWIVCKVSLWTTFLCGITQKQIS